jgi:hypothetical protein
MSYKASRWAVPVVLGIASIACSILASAVSCTQQDTKTATNIATKIADDICKEETAQPDAADWVAIACAVEAPASGVVHVLMPREQWNVTRGKKPTPCAPTPCISASAKPAFDAGPGK